jgi:hypothetical protein
MIRLTAMTTRGGMTLAAILPSVFCQELGREAGLGKANISALATAAGAAGVTRRWTVAVMVMCPFEAGKGAAI